MELNKLFDLEEKLSKTQSLSKGFTKEEKTFIESAYKEITGRHFPKNCGSCSYSIKILKNWMNANRKKDNQRDLLDQIDEETKPKSYADLLSEAKEKGLESKGKPKKEELIEFLSNK